MSNKIHCSDLCKCKRKHKSICQPGHNIPERDFFTSYAPTFIKNSTLEYNDAFAHPAKLCNAFCYIYLKHIFPGTHKAHIKKPKDNEINRYINHIMSCRTPFSKIVGQLREDLSHYKERREAICGVSLDAFYEAKCASIVPDGNDPGQSETDSVINIFNVLYRRKEKIILSNFYRRVKISWETNIVSLKENYILVPVDKEQLYLAENNSDNRGEVTISHGLAPVHIKGNLGLMPSGKHMYINNFSFSSDGIDARKHERVPPHSQTGMSMDVSLINLSQSPLQRSYDGARSKLLDISFCGLKITPPIIKQKDKPNHCVSLQEDENIEVRLNTSYKSHDKKRILYIPARVVRTPPYCYYRTKNNRKVKAFGVEIFPNLARSFERSVTNNNVREYLQEYILNSKERFRDHLRKKIDR